MDSWGEHAAEEAAGALAALAEGYCPIHSLRLTDADPADGGLCPICRLKWWGCSTWISATRLTPHGSYGHSWSAEQVRDMVAPRIILANKVSSLTGSSVWCS